MAKNCVLYDRECINCGECDICDLDPKKVCDNCGKCIDSGNDYNIMDVDLTVENGGEPLNYHFDGEEEADFEEEFFMDNDSDEDLEIELSDDWDDEDDDDDLAFDFGEFFGQR
ncbi:MAG: hypothetical protein IKW64_04870 [Clostridia bacterium]|nr:hypothetical protein [Clostridia bacterium]